MQTDNNAQKHVNPNKSQANSIAGKIIKFSLIIVSVILIYIIGSFIAFLTGLDLNFAPIQIEGVVKNSLTTIPVPDVEIKINDQIAKSDENGFFRVKNISATEITVSASKEGFRITNINANISRIFGENTYRIDLEIIPEKVGALRGKFIGSEGYRFLDDKLKIRGIDYKLETDGSFVISEIEAGEADLGFLSDNYQDIKTKINISEGSAVLEDIVLTAAGDIVGEARSFVRDDIVTNIVFQVANVEQDQIEVSSDGKFRIKDLEVGRTYDIRVFADGYVTRDYTATISQGRNDLFGFRLVENGSAIIYSRLTGQTESNFFRIDFDGQNPRQLTNVADRVSLDPSFEFFNVSNQTLYYISPKERIRGISQNVSLPYAVNVATGVETRLINNFGAIGQLTPNFRAMKTINVYEQNVAGGRDRIMSLVDFRNEELIELRRGRNFNFTELQISDNGDYVFYGEYSSNPNNIAEKNFYRVRVSDKVINKIAEERNLKLFDVSKDGNLVIYSSTNQSGFTELIEFNIDRQQRKVLSGNFSGSQVQFWEQDESKLIFLDIRDSRAGIFMMDLSDLSTRRVLGSGDSYRFLHQQDQYTFYITQRGLYVVDLSKPQNLRLVSTEIFYKGRVN